MNQEFNQKFNDSTTQITFSCPVCNLMFPTIEDFMKHDCEQHESKKLSCNICSKTYNSLTLAVHILVHSNNTVYECDSCGGFFFTQVQFNKHGCNYSEEIMNQETEQTECLRVNYQNINTGASIYKWTVIADTSSKKYQCDFCGESFIKKCKLAIHIARSHTAAKSYKCQDCQKSFDDISNLRAHKKCHTQKKSFQCDYCNKSFIEKVKLILHIRTHTTEKSYKCQVCHKLFWENYIEKKISIFKKMFGQSDICSNQEIFYINQVKLCGI